MYAELILGLLVVIPILNVLARTVNVPYPIVFVLAGLLLAVIPGVPTVTLAPELCWRWHCRCSWARCWTGSATIRLAAWSWPPWR